MEMQHNDVELNFEIDMTKEKLREILNIVENAEKQALIGQVLRVKLNYNTLFTFKNLAIIKSNSSIIRSTEETVESTKAPVVRLN